MGAWAAALWFALCRVDVASRRARAAALVPLLTWLYVGLFITAHDAMHALVAPRHRRLNDAVGRLTALLYAQFDYDALRVAHAEHHRAPASAQARRDVARLASLASERRTIL
jgi:beta-carotene ketolase (CrtW type)